MSRTMSNILDDVTIRRAVAADLVALERVAALDSRKLPSGPLLVALVDGEIRAAVSIFDGGQIADPFFLTADLLRLLCTRASQLREADASAARQVRPGLRVALQQLGKRRRRVA